MNKRFFLSIFFTIITTLNGNPPIRDLESSYSPFVLETKRLIIPEHPTAFNPSIIRWRDSLIMCFRVYSPHSKTVTAVGVVKLDEDFNPIGKTQILNIHYGGEFPSREQDPRLIEVGDHLYMVYSNFDRKNDWVNWIESVTPNSSEQPDSTFVNIVRDVLNVDRTTQPKEARRVFVA